MAIKTANPRHFCDRCGVEVGLCSGDGFISPITYESTQWFQGSVTKDLCWGCRIEFRDWMRKGGTNG